MIKAKSNYTMYEYTYSTEEYGDVVILANIKNENGTDFLQTWLKTNDNMGLMHFIIGYRAKGKTEEYIEAEVFQMAQSGYFDDFIESAIDEEEDIERLFMDRMENN